MRPLRTAALLLFLPLLPAAAQAAPSDDEDWKMMGGVLALLQQVVHLAANSPDPQAAGRSVDAILSGANPEANRLASGLLGEVMADVPAEHRGVVAALGKDLLVLARREQARLDAAGASRPAVPLASSREDAVRARKDLQAMGLRYWDEQQFLEAVRRGDRIAVDLFLAAQGLESRAEAPRTPPTGR